MSNVQNASRSSAFAAVEGDHWVESLDDGRHVLIRPLREEDRERERQFINRLSPATRHFRFLGEIKEASPALLDQLMDIDYQQSMAFVAWCTRTVSCARSVSAATPPAARKGSANAR